MRESVRLGSVLWYLLPISIIFIVYRLFAEVSVEDVQNIISENRLLGAGLLMLLMFATTVVAPLASLPLVPILAPLLGPFTTGLASFLGWSLGAFVAFWIGRQYGRPLAGKLVNLETLNRYEHRLTPETGFLLIVVLRMLVPVDVLSYAIGIFTKVSFTIYAFATMLGVVWFSFAFAYAGAAVTGGDYVLLTGIGVASVLILGVSWYLSRKLLKR